MLNFMDDTMKKKRDETQRGRMLAKAVIRRKSGQLEAVVVYEGSKPTDFFWTYRLRSPRSPRKSWKSTGFTGRFYNPYAQQTFESWLVTHALGGEIVSVKIYHAKKLKELMQKPERDFYGRSQELEPWQTQNLRAKESSKLRGTRALSWRGQ